MPQENSIPLPAEAVELDAGKLVFLYKLDLTVNRIGGQVYYFTPSSKEPVTFMGQIYTPFPITADGFEKVGEGPYPRPRLQISNVNNFGSTIINDVGELLGGELTRTITFEKYLNDPDATERFEPEVYYIDRKSGHTNQFIEFELVSAVDQEGVRVPRRRAIRNVCSHIYRVWNPATGDFDYRNVTCPYVGAAYFDRLGNDTTEPAEDNCGKRVSDCKRRFRAAPLPFDNFPASARTRAR